MDRPVFISPSPGVFNFEGETFSLKGYLEDIEKGILESMVRTYSSTYKIADVLKINQSSVVRKLQKYGIRPPRDG
ncbi:MAG: hypothetical protein ACI4OU_03930 [Candidatus Enterenecus sp.]